MKRLVSLFIAAALSLVLAAPALGADPVRPFGGRGGGADSAGPPTCPGAAWQYTSTGSGEMLHLGHVDMVVTHCTWLDSATTGHFGPGTITFTAANGDTLVLRDWGTFEIVATPNGLFSYVDLSWEAIGGTGRFVGATGSGGASPISDIAANTTTATFWGRISY